MKADIFKGQWPQIRSGIKANWDKITDDDLDAVGLNEEKFMKILQNRYGYSADTAKREFGQFMRQQAGKKRPVRTAPESVRRAEGPARSKRQYGGSGPRSAGSD